MTPASHDPGVLTPRLRLRATQPRDVDVMAALLGQPAVRRMMPTLRGLAPGALAPMIADAAGNVLDVAVLARRSGRVLGQINLSAAANELQFWLGAEHWGRGLGAEMIAGIMPRARTHHPDRPVVAHCLRDNPASARILERNGFQFRGLRQMAFGMPPTGFAVLRYATR